MPAAFTRRRRRIVLMLFGPVLLLAVAAQLEAQFGFGGGRNFRNVRLARPEDIDGRFQFCRAVFNNDFRGDADGNWSVDYPRADINLSIRLAELTKASVSIRDGEPNYLTVRFTDPALFGCPFVMMTEVGSASISGSEAEALRQYLLKGGFLWADDFWGDYAWQWWEGQLRKVLPAADYPIVDLPPTHPLYSSQFVITKTPQISNIGTWMNTGGGTSERGAESAVVNTRAILDRRGHIMVLMTHNTDLGDSFEREADDPQYFLQMSVPGYAFGVNTLLYALTH
jgi:hypothetical protein